MRSDEVPPAVSPAAAPSPKAAPWRRPRALAALIAVLLAVIGGGAWAYVTLTEPCPGPPLPVTVAAQPEIAPALRDIADRFGTQHHRVADRCVEVQIVAEGSAKVAADLAAGRASADGWVPESAIWFTVARRAGAAESLLPQVPTALAGSPVVLATTRPAGRELQAAGVRPSWRLLRSPLAGGMTLARRMLDPSANTSGTFAMIALEQVAGARGEFLDELKRTAPKDMEAMLEELTSLERFDRPLVVTTEQAVVAYNETHRPNPAVVLTPREGTLMVDYPMAVIAQEPQRREAVEAFASALRSRATRDTLQRYGFRAPDGTINGGYARRHGLDPDPPRPLRLPTQRQIDRALRSWK